MLIIALMRNFIVKKIEKLLNTHIQANEVTQVIKPFNIFSDNEYNCLKNGEDIFENKSDASKADTIASSMKKTLTERMRKDPVLYEKFSVLIQDIINQFREGRISGKDYYDKVSSVREDFISGERFVPESLKGNGEACALYDILQEELSTEISGDNNKLSFISSETALSIQKLLDDIWKVDFWKDIDCVKSFEDKVEDHFLDNVNRQFDMNISFENVSRIIERVEDVLRSRRSN